MFTREENLGKLVTQYDVLVGKSVCYVEIWRVSGVA